MRRDIAEPGRIRHKRSFEEMLPNTEEGYEVCSVGSVCV